MTINIKKISLFLAICLALSACNGFFEKDNTPTPSQLVKFTPEVTPNRAWMENTHGTIGEEYLRLNPAINETAIFTVSPRGRITATNRINGYTLWKKETNIQITASPGIGDQLIVVGGRHGEVAALSQTTGQLLWYKTISGQILAKPAISHGVVIIKAIDGSTQAFSTKDGHEIWSFQQSEPNLILRAASAPVIQDRAVLVGYANGNLAKLTLDAGQLRWLQAVATPEGGFAIQRMIDLDADPVVFHHRIYAATYQGKIASLDWESGNILWSRYISSYTGMVVDEQAIYITDASGVVWCFNNEGEVKWRQTKLVARVLTAPASMGNYIVVGDAEGYLHWLSKQDGHFAARTYVGPLYAAPVVQDNILYVYTNRGYLAAYTLG